MKKVKGNLIKLGKKGEFDVIIHGSNCFCQMGAGIALQIKNQFPEAYAVDLETNKGDRTKLGTFSYAEIDRFEKPLIVINAYTQYHWKGKKNADYDAIRSVFHLIKENFPGLKIGYPMIGAGLAGGNWKIISSIINEELDGENHTFVEFKK